MQKRKGLEALRYTTRYDIIKHRKQFYRNGRNGAKMKKLSSIDDIMKCLEIHANLPWNDDEDEEIDYNDSLVFGLLNYIDGKGSFPDMEKPCLEILDVLFELASIFNDEEIYGKFSIDFSKNIFFSGPLPTICYIMSSLLGSLFALHLIVQRQNNIEPEKIDQLRCIILILNHAWEYVLSGEPSEFFWSDIYDMIETPMDNYGLTYLTWGLDMISDKNT